MFVFQTSDNTSYLDAENEDLIVTNLLEKYKISTDTSFLYNLNDDYHALIDYVSELYINNKEIPQDIVEQINNNINFKTYLLVAIRNKMKNILSDNSTIIFKEIVTIVNLLSFGKDYNIFESYNFYNIENLGELFREYEQRLQELKQNDEKNFLITFNHYTTLIEAINELCTINSTDVLRKKSINPIIDTISETINIIKYNIKLEDHQINILNNILGKLLFFYSHIPYINTANKDAQYLIDEFKFIFEKVCDGYVLSKDTNFGGYEQLHDYYKIFLNSVTTLLCTLLYKLEQTYKEEEYSNVKQFEHVFELYEEVITHIDIPQFTNLSEFKNHLLNNYLYIYDKTLQSSDECIIDRFLEMPEFNSSNMHIIHSIVLFSCRIDDRKLLRILNILITMDKFDNDYHEFFKLNVCDVIINRFTYSEHRVMHKELIQLIVDYIEENKIASHLMSIYSKIYLSLSLYFSFFDDYESIEQSKLYYFYYVNINGKDLLENEYINLNRDILYNHGRMYIYNFDLENVLISDTKCIEIGQKVLDKFFIREEIHTKFKINQSLSNIVTDIFTNDGLNDDLLNSYIEKFISRDIFYGLTFCSVEGLCEAKCSLVDLGYEKIEIPLMEGYTLRMAYSNVYKHIFEYIYENNKEYIKQNVINLIVSYIKSAPIYIDQITKLPNIEKAKLDIFKREDENLVFVEFYIENLFDINSKYGYTKTNDIFQEYAQKVNEIVDSYRLTGPKLGFVLNEAVDYKLMIDKVREVNMSFKGEEIKPKLIFAVAFGNNHNLLDKSNHAISLALKSEQKYYEFK